MSPGLVGMLAPLVRDRLDLKRLVLEHLLTCSALGEAPRARLFSLLLGVDILDCRASASLEHHVEPGGYRAHGGVGAIAFSDERCLAAVACQVAAVYADEGFAKSGAPVMQDHCSGILLRSLVHLGASVRAALLMLVASPPPPLRAPL